MISSTEFHQTLQAGKIHQALALLVRDAAELDITTRLTAASPDLQPQPNAYLRTKINLLTGEIQNDIGRDVVADGTNYLKLQQLHIDQILASDRIVQSYLQQLKTILVGLAVVETQPQPTAAPPLNAEALLARLTQAARSSAAAAESTVVESGSFAPLETNDDDLDLSIDLAGDVWEEWVEDEDFSAESIVLPSVYSIADQPDCEESWVRRHLNRLEVTPHQLDTSSEPTTAATRWDKFGPDWIGIDPPPLRVAKNSDVQRQEG